MEYGASSSREMFTCKRELAGFRLVFFAFSVGDGYRRTTCSSTSLTVPVPYRSMERLPEICSKAIRCWDETVFPRKFFHAEKIIEYFSRAYENESRWQQRGLRALNRGAWRKSAAFHVIV